MKKKNVLWMSMLLLISVALFSCSSDDEYEQTPLYGYWEHISNTDDGNHYGLFFQRDGKVNTWSLCQGEYAEEEWGTWWSENGEIYINDHFGLVVDGLYYKIVSLTESRLVIHVWGGFAGTPYEKGYDEEYKRLSNKPNNNGI